MPSRIADRLTRARGRQMVGRETEIALFRTALEAEELPFLLLYLCGPGGIGKSTLLHALRSVADAQDISTLLLDARNFDATPEGFLSALSLALSLPASANPMTVLGEENGRRILFIDTYENLIPLDDWFRDTFVPQLSADTLLVLAAQPQPPAAWRADPGWQSLVRMRALRNFSPAESEAYLNHRGIAPEHHQAILDFTHGYPLALSLIADVGAQLDAAQTGSALLDLEAAPDIVKTLLERFVDKVPGPAYRAGLQAAALVRLTTEGLLEEMLSGLHGVDDFEAHEVFEWLRSLSFVEANRYGIYPHDVAREALLADLRWRNRDRYAELHRRARDYYVRQLEEMGDIDQQRTLFDFIFLHRDNTIVRQAFEWQVDSPVRPDVLQPGDVPAIVAMVREHEGAESAKWAEKWIAEQPESVMVFRSTSDPLPLGFLMYVALQKASPELRDADPATRSAWECIQANGVLRPNDAATYFRFWMARDTYQEVSTVQSLVVVNAVRHYLITPNLAYTFFPVANLAFWKLRFAYAEIPHRLDCEFMVEGKLYSVFGHDWRTVTPPLWLSRLADKEIAMSNPLFAPPRPEPLLALSETEFQSGVRSALKGFAESDGLDNNPLLRTKMIAERLQGDTRLRTAPINNSTRSAALRSLLQEAVESLENSPRLSRCYRPLLLTYLRPAPSQEKAAEMLDLPFSTFRRHLTEGITEVTRLLWRREIGEGDALMGK